MLNRNNYILIVLLLWLSSLMCNVTHQLAIVVPATGGTISSSGSYYLDWNVTGAITIATSNVTLNLNQHTVSAPIIVNSSLRNVVLYNGAIQGDGNGLIVGAGCDAITVDAMLFEAAYIYMAGTSGSPINNMLISNVLVENCITPAVTAPTSIYAGYLLQECSGEIVNSTAYNNVGDGLYAAGATSILTIENFYSSNNSFISNYGNGLHFQDNGLFFCKSVIAKNNGFNGFNLDTNGGTLVCNNCDSSYNAVGGFQLLHNCTMDNCLAVGNSSTGFFAQNGLFYIGSCIALTNISDGFRINITGAFAGGVVTKCIACNNGTGSVGAGFNTIGYQQADPLAIPPILASSLYFFSNYAANNNQFALLGFNYALSSGLATKGSAGPYYWQSWNNSVATSRYNVDGNNN